MRPIERSDHHVRREQVSRRQREHLRRVAAGAHVVLGFLAAFGAAIAVSRGSVYFALACGAITVLCAGVLIFRWKLISPAGVAAILCGLFAVLIEIQRFPFSHLPVILVAAMFLAGLCAIVAALLHADLEMNSSTSPHARSEQTADQNEQR